MRWRRTDHVSWVFAVASALSALGPWSPAAAQAAPAIAAATQTWAASLTDRLKLSAAQAAALKDYLAALSDQSAQPPKPSEDQFRAMTTPERLEYRAGRIELDLKVARAQSQAARRFYDLLSVDQRTLFDEATAPLTIHLDPPAVVSADLPGRPDYKLPSHTNPDWLVKPDGDDMARVYPSAAQAHNVAGRAVITCRVDVYGYLADCVVDSESPKDQGFGNAALEMTAYFRMQPATDYGVPTPSEVTVPIAFAPDPGSAGGAVSK